MHKLYKYIRKEVSWCILFVDNIVLVDNTREGIIFKVERWIEAFESKRFTISKKRRNICTITSVKL